MAAERLDGSRDGPEGPRASTRSWRRAPSSARWRSGSACGCCPRLLLELAFGADFRSGDAVLLELGIAFALLAGTTIAVQFLLGLHWRAFVVALALVAVAEPLLLLGADSPASFAGRVLAAQAAGAAVAVALALRSRRDPLAATGPVI